MAIETFNHAEPGSEFALRPNPYLELSPEALTAAHNERIQTAPHSYEAPVAETSHQPHVLEAPRPRNPRCTGLGRAALDTIRTVEAETEQNHAPVRNHRRPRLTSSPSAVYTAPLETAGQQLANRMAHTSAQQPRFTHHTEGSLTILGPVQSEVDPLTGPLIAPLDQRTPLGDIAHKAYTDALDAVEFEVPADASSPLFDTLTTEMPYDPAAVPGPFPHVDRVRYHPLPEQFANTPQKHGAPAAVAPTNTPMHRPYDPQEQFPEPTDTSTVYAERDRQEAEHATAAFNDVDSQPADPFTGIDMKALAKTAGTELAEPVQLIRTKLPAGPDMHNPHADYDRRQEFATSLFNLPHEFVPQHLVDKAINSRAQMRRSAEKEAAQRKAAETIAKAAEALALDTHESSHTAPQQEMTAEEAVGPVTLDELREFTQLALAQVKSEKGFDPQALVVTPRPAAPVAIAPAVAPLTQESTHRTEVALLDRPEATPEVPAELPDDDISRGFSELRALLSSVAQQTAAEAPAIAFEQPRRRVSDFMTAEVTQEPAKRRSLISRLARRLTGRS